LKKDAMLRFQVELTQAQTKASMQAVSMGAIVQIAGPALFNESLSGCDIDPCDGELHDPY
jgi:hypothetical protein